MEPFAYSTHELLATAVEILTESGYEHVKASGGADQAAATLEDSRGVVRLAVFETVPELIELWPSEQEALVRLMSQNLTREESKSWDGYLVLLTPGPSLDFAVPIEEIRYNTVRVRKFVATGEFLQGEGHLRRFLSPLTPIAFDAETDAGPIDPLAMLSSLVGEYEEEADVVVKAFRSGEPLIERLELYLRERGR